MSMFRFPDLRAVCARLRAVLAAALLAAHAAALLPLPAAAPAVAGAALALVVVASPEPALAQGDPFGEVDTKGRDFVTFVYKMLRWGALLGIAGAVALGFFGNLNWGTVFYIALGCVVVSIAPGIIDWLGNGQFSSPNLQ